MENLSISCEANSCMSESYADIVQPGDVVVTDFDEAKKIIGGMLQSGSNIDVLAEIILYNTETFLKFFWSRPSAPDYECMNCYFFRLDEGGYDCEGRECLLCPHFSFIPRGFEKFSECIQLKGSLEFDDWQPDLSLDSDDRLSDDLLEELKNM